MSVVPVELRKTEDRQLAIRWSDGVEQLLPLRQLRNECPCATCREKASAKSTPPPSTSLPILSAAQTMPLDILRMRPVGNYGYIISFSDGHDSGIFTFEYLRRMGLGTDQNS